MLQSELMKDGVRFVPIVIVGAGVSGIAAGCRLKQKLNFTDFEIYDRCSALGGTWHVNSYPGCACDIPAIFYSFSFNQNPRWTHFNPGYAEIAEYLRDTCDKFKITDRIKLNTLVANARWLEGPELWEVSLVHLKPEMGDLGGKRLEEKIANEGEASAILGRETVRCKVLLSALGGFVEHNEFPKDIPGSETFKGPLFHSARWDHSVDFNGKDVVILGTGCSAAQIVPRLIEAPYNAKSVVQLMREPPWVVPQIQPPGGAASWKFWSSAMLRVPVLSKVLRLTVATATEKLWPIFDSSVAGTKQRRSMEGQVMKYLHTTVPEEYHAMLTPSYSLGCKRIIFDRLWFRSLNSPKIDLTTKKLVKVTPDGYVLGPEYHYPHDRSPDTVEERKADIFVLANGFQAQEWLMSLQIFGVGGVSLHDVWKERGGSQAYRGTAMDGFPNMFIIFGPNTATGHSSVILASENMVELALKFIEPILKGHATTVEVKKQAELDYTHDIQTKLKTKVWSTGGCHSWYKTDSWNSTTYPYVPTLESLLTGSYSQIKFTFNSLFPTFSDWNIAYTPKGRRALKLRWWLKLFGSFGAILLARLLVKAKFNYRDIPNMIRSLF